MPRPPAAYPSRRRSCRWHATWLGPGRASGRRSPRSCGSSCRALHGRDGKDRSCQRKPWAHRLGPVFSLARRRATRSQRTGRVRIDDRIGCEPGSHHLGDPTVECVDGDVDAPAVGVLEHHRPTGSADAPETPEGAPRTEPPEGGLADAAYAAAETTAAETTAAGAAERAARSGSAPAGQPHGPHVAEVDNPPAPEDPDADPSWPRSDRPSSTDPDGEDDGGEGDGGEQTPDHAPHHR